MADEDKASPSHVIFGHSIDLCSQCEEYIPTKLASQDEVIVETSTQLAFQDKVKMGSLQLAYIYL